jgi:hypothetical protein
VNDEQLVPVAALWESCTSRQALAAATDLAAERDRGAAAWSVGTDDGCDHDGRSTRWEVRFDLSRRQELIVSIGFPPDEAKGAHGDAVASIRLVPFPAEGSELARMALSGEITGRRLRAVWRQQTRDREPLPWDFPDSAAVAQAVAPDRIRTAHARITRARGACWVVRTKARVRHLRIDDLR